MQQMGHSSSQGKNTQNPNPPNYAVKAIHVPTNGKPIHVIDYAIGAPPKVTVIPNGVDQISISSTPSGLNQNTAGNNNQPREFQTSESPKNHSMYTSSLSTHSVAFQTSAPPSTHSVAFQTSAQPSTHSGAFQTSAPPSTHSVAFQTSAQPSTQSGAFQTSAPSSTHSVAFQTSTPPSTHSGAFQTSAPPSTHSGAFQTSAPSSTHSGAFQTSAPPSTHSGAFQTSAPSSTHSGAFQTSAPSSTHSVAFQTSTPPSKHSGAFQTSAAPSTHSGAFQTSAPPSTHSGAFQTSAPPSTHSGAFQTSASPSTHSGACQTSASPSTHSGAFQTSTQPSMHSGAFQTSAPPSTHSGEFQTSAPPSTHSGAFQTSAPPSKHSGAFQTSAPPSKHSGAFQTSAPPITHSGAFQTSAPSSTHSGAFQTSDHGDPLNDFPWTPFSHIPSNDPVAGPEHVHQKNLQTSLEAIRLGYPVINIINCNRDHHCVLDHVPASVVCNTEGSNCEMLCWGHHQNFEDQFLSRNQLDRRPIQLKHPPAPVYRRPPTIMCYICSREYGTASIGIHEKQCLSKWKFENDQLPPAMRRPVPVKPQPIVEAERALKSSKSGTYNLDAINEAAFQAAQLQYLPCQKCGRTFLPDRLPVHEKNCRGKKELKRNAFALYP